MSRGLTLFVAAALPKLPIRAIYLGNRSFIAEFARAHPA